MYCACLVIPDSGWVLEIPKRIRHSHAPSSTHSSQGDRQVNDDYASRYRGRKLGLWVRNISFENILSSVLEGVANVRKLHVVRVAEIKER